MILLQSALRNPAQEWDDFGPIPAETLRPRRRLKITLAEAVVVAMISVVLISLLLPGGDFNFDHRYLPFDPNTRFGFAGLAGEYRLGVHRGGRGWCLSILADGRYSINWSCCVGVGYRESGSVKRVGEDLVLAAAAPTEGRFARVFRPVKWGCRTYLIPPEKLREFCDAIIKGDEPRNERTRGLFYALNLGEQIGGAPELPEPWATYLRKHAVFGTDDVHSGDFEELSPAVGTKVGATRETVH
jgi:hypothetical protein